MGLFHSTGVDHQTVRTRAQTDRDYAFLSIFQDIEQRYRDHLTQTKTIDFNDMINDARAAIQSGAYQSRFRFIIVDEFQDISQQRLDFLLDLRAQVAHAKLFVVGDDWQAIYRFTGSDIKIITNLETYVGSTARVDLDTTFRYPQELLDASAIFITANDAQITKELRAHGGAAGEPPFVLIHQADTTPEAMTTALDRAIEDIRCKLDGRHGHILILGRYKRLEPCDLAQRVTSLKQYGITIAYQTMHSAKGKEADFVILVGLKDGSFPSTISDDPVLRMVLPSQESYLFAEERRLWYVAITRTRNCNYLIMPSSRVSSFLREMSTSQYAQYLTTLVQPPRHMVCPMCAEDTMILRHEGQSRSWRCVAVGCAGQRHLCRACSQGAMVPYAAPEPAVRCSDCGTIQSVCPRCHTGLVVELKGKYGIFRGCSNWSGNAGCTFTAPRLACA